MTTRDTSGRIERLERTRAELEGVLARHSDWRVLRRTTSAATRATLERALQDDAVYRAWRLLDQVIAEMRAGTAAHATVGLAPPDETQDNRHRVSLRDVLESIRVEGAGAFDDDPVTPLVATPETAAVVATTEPGSAQAPTAGLAHGSRPLAADDLEEATVSFVVRELEPGVGTAAEPGPASGAPRRGAAPSPPPAQARRDGADTVADHEAEVTIVPRRR